LGKDKLKRFEEMKSFDRLFQPTLKDITSRDYYLKGKWASEVFHNENKIILELGCGKGEYTLELAKKFPEKNFIGIDIKGARIWKGSKTSNVEGILNTAFLRTRIEFINSFFGKDEVSEIWLTFPDPQEKERRKKKRLTGSLFLGRYQQFLVDGGIVHLKTDNTNLFTYTLELLKHNDLEVLYQTTDLYNDIEKDDVLGIKTYYENVYLGEGRKINYLKFRLPHNKVINEKSENK